GWPKFGKLDDISRKCWVLREICAARSPALFNKIVCHTDVVSRSGPGKIDKQTCGCRRCQVCRCSWWGNVRAIRKRHSVASYATHCHHDIPGCPSWWHHDADGRSAPAIR